MDLLKKLNPSQQEAVLHGAGPLLILAGAGSGKTRVIVHRIAYLISHQGVNPRHLLAVTFTNKAAAEMAERVRGLLKSDDLPLIATFHSFCARLLRREVHLLGFERNFAIYDDKDVEKVLKEVIGDLRLDDKRYAPKAMAAAIDEWKNAGLRPEDVAAGSTYQETVRKVYATYQERLRRCNALDFGDLLLKAVEVFDTFPEVLARYRDRYRWIMVDEYQDTNPIQYRLVKLLAGELRNLCVVGDDDQSIYRWRGADIRNILDFEKDFPAVKVVKLEQNYRSTQTILAAAGSVVRKNVGRKGKELWTSNPAGEKVVCRTLREEREEARYVCQEIDGYLRQGRTAAEIAVFYRVNAQSRVIEDALVAEGIPYHIVGGMRFFERLEIKDVLAYLKVINNPADEVALRRIINTPPRGIGVTTLDRIGVVAAERGVSFAAALREAATGQQFPPGMRTKLAGFTTLLDEFSAKAETLSLAELTSEVIATTGYARQLQAERSEQAEDRLANLEELISSMRDFEGQGGEQGLAAYLEQVALISDLERSESGKASITLMTLHGAKGLEFPIVFITGMEERVFPHVRALDDPEQMEEERRLCYVGMTRARELLYLTNATRRRIFGQEQYNLPSRFIGDIDRDLLDLGESPQVATTSGTYRYREQEPGPAWHNLAAVAALGQEVVPDNEVRVVPDEPQDTIILGMKVRHGKFGVGTVRKIEGSGDEQKIVVWFNSVGPKKLLVRFAGLERA
ncbi:MAG TPA: UvrD-helicase domain-containing protein [Geobacteraceae bacterium]